MGFFFGFFFYLFCCHSPSPKFPLGSADTLPHTHTHTHTNTHSQRSCRLLTDVWRESLKVLSQTKICRLLVCTVSVQNRQCACDNEKLARIPRHGTVPRYVHLLDVPPGRVPIRAYSPSTTLLSSSHASLQRFPLSY